MPSRIYPACSVCGPTQHKETIDQRVARPGAQRRARVRYWPDVDRLFAVLPPHLFRQAKLLQYDLALQYSRTGQFQDIFLDSDEFPLLWIAPWLLDDLQFPDGPERDTMERHLFVVAVLLAARTQAIDGMWDAASFYDDAHLALVEFLSDRTTTELARVLPRESPFWTMREALLVEELEQLLEDRERRRGAITSDEPEAYLRGRWSAPAKVLGLAVATLAGRQELVADIIALLDAVADVFQIQADLKSVHDDLLAARPTFPIATIARAAEIPLYPWPEATAVLGAIAATGSVDTIIGFAAARLRDCGRAATDLRLPTFSSFLEEVEARIGDHSPAAPLFNIAEPTLPKALAMAETFLLADLTFKESWETHREGMFGSAEVASRFPAGLILEVLSARGHDLSRQVDDFLAFTAANGFRYFAHPSSDVDSDTVGVFLRLRAYATRPDAHAGKLDVVLGCLERRVGETREVPVWITGCDPSPTARPPVVDLGESCGTVAAHLLLGLSSAGLERYRTTIETGSFHLLERIKDVGLGANVNYPPLFALAAFFRLTARIATICAGSDLAGRALQVRDVLLAELDRAVRYRPLTPQQAALLTIACLDGAATDRLNPRWVVTILKGQRFDGSWGAEPFAAAPNRGNSVTWYSSTALATTICYDALKRCAP
jgi:hypothetical protein